MRITVAIITRNRERQLAKCLRSLVKQTVKSFEVLIVDNDSTDSTHEAVLSFKKKLKIRYVLEKKVGRSSARNRIFEEAKTTDLLITIDDDCEATPNWIANIVSSHKKFPGAAVIQGRSISIPKKRAVSVIAQFIHESAFKDNIAIEKNFFYQFTKQYLIQPNPILLIDTKNAVFNMAILRKLHIKFNTNWKHAEDYEFSKQILAKHKTIIFDPKIIVYHTERAELKDFLQQRYGVGVEATRTRLLWPKYFPSRKGLWWIGRGLNFFFFLGQNKLVLRSPALISLFILEKNIYLFGKYKELWFKN